MGVNNYNKLKKKYGLPEHKKLVELLEIDIDPSKNEVLLLQEIRNHITDRMYDLMKTIESILFTGEGSDPGHLYQEEMIKNSSGEAFEVFKDFNQLNYEGFLLRFKHDRKADAAFINKIFRLWPSMEKKMIKFFSELENGWKGFDGPLKEIKHETYHG
ncbi:MAG TPA: hypothetical protein VJB06_03870 [archaeon]|nr:hypothetical protein [archaeon]